MSYNFNVPYGGLYNQGSAGATVVSSIVTVGTSCIPAKNRGLYFNGTNFGHVTLADNLYLSHTFSLHSWVMPTAVAQMVIFWKDRDSGFATGDGDVLRAGIHPSFYAQSNLARDGDPSFAWAANSATVLTTQTWTYLIWSYEMLLGCCTEIVIYYDNIWDSSTTCADYFYIDKVGYKGYLGLKRNNNAPETFFAPMNGFIYDFHIYQSKHTVSNTAHATTCTSAWATWGINEYATGSAWDGDWAEGWASSRACSLSSTCDATCPQWHLCADVECTSWLGYDAGQCDTGFWAQSGFAQESAGQCSCSSGYGRSSRDELCSQCHPDCTSCDYISVTTYQGCQACGTGVGITYNTSYVYWTHFCPTGQTAVGTTCVGTLGTVFEAKLEGFASSWTYNGITLNSSGRTIPAKNRGQYFDRDQLSFMEFTDFYLNTDFTISSWIRLNTLGLNQQTIFGVSDGEPTQTQLWWISVGNVGQIKIRIRDVATGTTENAITGTYINSSAWYFLATSFVLNADAISQTVTAKLDGNSEEIDNIANCFIDNATPVTYKKFLGNRKGDSTGVSGFFGGFIYGIWIENVAQTGNRAQYLDPSLWSSCTLCATADNEWLDNYEFTDFVSGTCDVSSCTSKGCVRAAACQSWSFSYCHLWNDIEWVNWTGYTDQDCTQCSASSTLDGTGGWQCTPGSVRQTVGDNNTQCISCNGFVSNGFCVSTWPSPGWYSDTYGKQCIQCPSNWDTCQGVRCTICNYSYVLRNDGSWYDSCQAAQYATESREWQDCFGTCLSCVGSGYDQCSTCATGLIPVDSAAQEFTCDCSDTTNTSKDVKFECVKQSLLEGMNSQYVLDHLDSITNSENLNEEDFDIFVNTVDDADLITQSLQHDAIRVINSAGQETITNQPSVEVEVSTEKFYAKLKAEQVTQLEGTKILTSTGSGVQMPGNLVQQNVIQIDTRLAVSVVQMKGDENQRVLGLDGFDVVSVEVYELFKNGTSSLVQFQDLTTNFTIIFDGQRFNTTLQHECVHYTNGNWTNSGCWLSLFDVWYAECTCNHLTEFSLRKFGEEAAPDSNVGATIDFSVVSGLDENTNYTPMVLISIIIAIYIIVFIYLHHKDRITRRQGLHENDQTAEQIHEFALQIMAQQAAERELQSNDSSYMSSSSEVPSGKYLVESTEPDRIQKISVVPDDELFETVKKAVTTEQHEMSFSMSNAELEIQNISQILQPPLKNQMELAMAQETHTSQFPFQIQKANQMVWDEDISYSPHEIQDSQDDVQDTEGSQPQISPKSVRNTSNTPAHPQSNLIVSTTFRNRFLEEHPIIGVFNHYEKQIKRKERCTVLFVMLILTIFCTGLFYNEENVEEEEDAEKSASESWHDMRIQDLYIILYSTIVTIPAPLTIKFLFRRKKIDPAKDYSKQIRTIKIKRVIAYILTFCLAVWCTWSCIAFSLDFGYNKTQKWMFSVIIAEIFDFVVKDNLVTLALAALAICVAYIKDRRSRVKNIKRDHSK